MKVLATFICSAANVAAAREISADVPLDCELSSDGSRPPTHYVSSGRVDAAVAAQLAALCTVVTTPHEPLVVIADADLRFCDPAPR